MEFRMGQAWARWSVLEGKWTHRFAPDLAPLRCARPVVFPLLSKAGCLAQPPRHERFRALSADFRFGGTVAGGERDLEAPGAGNRGAGRFCRHPLGMPAVSTADADSRLRRATVAAFGQLPVQDDHRVAGAQCAVSGTWFTNGGGAVGGEIYSVQPAGRPERPRNAGRGGLPHQGAGGHLGLHQVLVNQRP